MNELKQMISVIGQRRSVVLFVLIAINVVLFLGLENIFSPQNEEASSMAGRVKSEFSSISTEINELPERHKALKINDDKYVSLMMKGLFADQDRIEARAKIDKLRGQSGLRGVEYKIEPQKKIDDAAIAGINGQIVLTEIGVQIKSLTDREMRAFIDNMREEFSGLVMVKDIKFERSNPVSDENLLKLTKKEPVDFVTGNVSFEWYSMIIKEGMPEGAAAPGRDGPDGMFMEGVQ
jgi:hypothetical protein